MLTSYEYTHPQSRELLCYKIEFSQLYILYAAKWQFVIGDVDIGPKISKLPTNGSLRIMWATFPTKREHVTYTGVEQVI